MLYIAVFKKYQSLAPDGDIASLNKCIADIIHCPVSAVYDSLESLLSFILPRKPMKAFGVTESDLAVFTENTMTKQGRLTANNYQALSADDVYGIYRSVF